MPNLCVCGLLSPYLTVPSLVMCMDVADVFILHLGYTRYEVVAGFHKSKKKNKCFTKVYNICVSPFVTYFKPLFWHTEFWDSFYILGKFVDPSAIEFKNPGICLCDYKVK